MTKNNLEKTISKYLVVRQLKARSRLLLSMVFALLMWFFLPVNFVHHDITRFIISWDFGAFLYLVLSLIMIIRSTHEKIQYRAQLEDEGQLVILVLVITAAIVSLVAIIAELGIVKDLSGSLKYSHLLLAVATILISWFFTHTMFALHYTHDYYARIKQGNNGGIDFPGTEIPYYSDFIYFAYVIGTSGQTADVSFSSKRLRRIGTVHCVLSFLFNTTVLALTINIASGLI